MKILITGATGFVGRRLTETLLKEQYTVVVVSRDVSKAKRILGETVQAFAWNPTSELIPREALENVDVVIHLLGENIGEKRWTSKQKKIIYDSRILSSENVVKSVQKFCASKPPRIISTSAIGVYGARPDGEVITENTSIGDDFLAKVCHDWEEAIRQGSAHFSGQVILRVGVVLGRDGGALKKLIPLFNLGLGGPIGNGEQWMSWIHLDDLVNSYLFCLKNPNLKGEFNVVTPNPVRNKNFGKILGKVLHRPSFLITPAFAIKAVMGEMSQIVLDSQYIHSQKLVDAGLKFQHPELENALKNIISRTS